MPTGTLYVVATPIGNLGDMTLRGIEVLKSVDRIAAEDTRHTRALLSHLNVEKKPMDALFAHSTPADIERLVGKLRDGENIALVSDAGTPLLSDPGAEFVRGAIAIGASIVPIPGASSLLAALVGSGELAHGFHFFGFLPRSGSDRTEVLERCLLERDPAVFFESPHRLNETLAEFAEQAPDRPACIARELTKLHEEFVRGTLSELAALGREWRGEIVVVLGAWDRTDAESPTDATLDDRIDAGLREGIKAGELASELAKWASRPRKEIYDRILARRGKR